MTWPRVSTSIKSNLCFLTSIYSVLALLPFLCSTPSSPASQSDANTRNPTLVLIASGLYAALKKRGYSFERRPVATAVIQNEFEHAVSNGHAESDVVQARLVVNGEERSAQVRV
jgi:hypothetical protein